MLHFGCFLKSLRVEKYTQRELAKQLGVSFPYISKLESGLEKAPSEKILYRIAEVFELHPSEVFIQAGRLPTDLSRWLISKPRIYKELLSEMDFENLETANNPNNILLNDRNFREFFIKSDRIMLLIDPEGGQIVDASESAQSFYGYDIQSFRKLSLTHINPLPPEELKQKMEQAKFKYKNVFKFNHVTKNGIKDVIVTSEPICVYGRTLLHSIVIDASSLE